MFKMSKKISIKNSDCATRKNLNYLRTNTKKGNAVRHDSEEEGVSVCGRALC